MHRLLTLLFVLSITGCASTRITPEDEKRIRTVAIITLVPEAARIEKIGLTVFNNERAEIDMGGSITSTIISVAKKRLSVARPQWTVKEIAYDRPRLIERINKPGMVMAYHEERIEKELAELASANHLDALLVINAQRYETIPGQGVGVWLRTMSLSSIQTALVHSNVDLKVVGPQGTVIARGRGLPETPKRIDPSVLGLSYEMKDNLRPELVKRLRFEIVEHLQKSINTRFDQLELN